MAVQFVATSTSPSPHAHLHLQAPDAQGRKGGQVHYENLCMKAVNQSIGEDW